MALSFKGTALFILATGLFLTTVPSFSDARDYTRCGGCSTVRDHRVSSNNPVPTGGVTVSGKPAHLAVRGMSVYLIAHLDPR